jgi:hypothetical protein
MTRTISFEYDPEHIPKLKDQVEVMMMQIKDEAYQKGIAAERERIIKLIETNMSGRDSWLTVIQLIKGEQK